LKKRVWLFFFAEHKSPNEQICAQVGGTIGLREKQVNTWLSHRRQKERKMERMKENELSYVSRNWLGQQCILPRLFLYPVLQRSSGTRSS
jgi:hypothetical protein